MTKDYYTGAIGELHTAAHPETEAQHKISERLNSLRRTAVKQLKQAGEEPGKEFTCDGCTDAPTCTYAYDIYNINGECLNK